MVVTLNISKVISATVSYTAVYLLKGAAKLGATSSGLVKANAFTTGTIIIICGQLSQFGKTDS